MLPEVAMPTKFKICAVVAALAASTSSAAMAQYACPPGYTYFNGVCQPVPTPGYSNPVSGAVSGEAAGAANGNATGGPVGAIVGGALGTAKGALTGTANMFAGAPPASACAAGYTYYSVACYAAR
jgi:outer membrane lipoprotein SlyB